MSVYAIYHLSRRISGADGVFWHSVVGHCVNSISQTFLESVSLETQKVPEFIAISTENYTFFQNLYQTEWPV